MRARQGFCGLLIASMLGLSWPSSAAEPLSPAQTAYLKAETRRIDERFVADVSRITGASATRVRRAMPDERRITAAVPRLISALEMDLGTLSEAQKAAIVNADLERKQALAQARASAGTH